MTTLEILLLHLAPGISPTDPSILQNMINVRTALRERVHNTNSRFYQCIADPTLIFIFGIWPDLKTHRDFLSDSALTSAILNLQQDQTAFKWMAHVEVGDIEELPFEAPVMVVEKWPLIESGEHVMGLDRHGLLMGRRALLVEGTKPYNVAEAWSSDPEPGRQELITISGWDSVEAHEAFRNDVGCRNEEVASLFGEIEVFCARNMET